MFKNIVISLSVVRAVVRAVAPAVVPVVVLAAVLVLASCSGRSISPLDLSGPPGLDTNEIALAIHKHINIERERAGLNALGWNDTIAGVADLHSTDMGKNGFFANQSPSTGSFSDRYESAGFKCETWVGKVYYSGAENVYMGHTYGDTFYKDDKIEGREWLSNDEIAKRVVKSWMENTGHRNNILTPYFLEQGIGVSITDKDEVLATQNFC